VVLAYRSKITNTTVLLQTSTNPDVNEWHYLKQPWKLTVNF
jgi:hypothetical protein